MLNLLNREIRHGLRKEYCLRLLNIFLMMLILTTVYYSVLLFSNTFLINLEKENLASEAERLALSSAQQDLIQYEQALNHVKIEYELFAADRILPTSIIEKILNYTISGISLSGISVNPSDVAGLVSIEVRGQSSNRETLLTYSNSLKENPDFSEVNIPLSSLTRNVDIPFTISMKYKTEKLYE